MRIQVYQSTFREAALLLWSFFWIWVGHNETSSERHLLRLTGHHRSRPPPRASHPVPEAADSQLIERRQIHSSARHQLSTYCNADVRRSASYPTPPAGCSPCWRPSFLPHKRLHCSCLTRRLQHMGSPGGEMGKINLKSFRGRVHDANILLCYLVNAVKYSAFAFLEPRSRTGQKKRSKITKQDIEKRQLWAVWRWS